MNRVGVEAWLKEYGVVNYTLNEDLSVDVEGDIDISFKDLSSVPVSFGFVSGRFNCGYNNLTSLVGSPISVGVFHCGGNKLVSLVGSPESVVGNFFCNSNKLSNLEGCYVSVGGDFHCYDNQLTSLEGCPVVLPVEHEYQFNCSGNNLGESQDFLYDYSAEQLCMYYKNKMLNEKLHAIIDRDVVVKSKNKKI